MNDIVSEGDNGKKINSIIFNLRKTLFSECFEHFWWRLKPVKKFCNDVEWKNENLEHIKEIISEMKKI